jgi:CCR4-NOT transcriptional regulation complex NOT5 subunit
MKRIACSGVGLVLFLGLAGVPAGAQNQAPSTSQNSSSGSSLGDYARQIRKDPGAKAKPKVFDNDNLPKEDKLSVVGQTLAPTSDNSAETKGAQSEGASPAGGEAKAAPENRTEGAVKPGTEVKAPSSTAKAPEDEATKQTAAKQWADKIAAQKDQIDLLARELDVVQREYQLRAAAMYADAGNRMRNSADWDKQDAQYKQQIADKQKALDDAKQKLDDVQEDARKAGVPASVREP